MRTGISGSKEPQTKEPSQVSYRHPLSSKLEIRRASEQTSPQVARAVGHPERDRRRIEEWQHFYPPRLFHGSELWPQRGKADEAELVAQRFRGESTHKVDAKGRVSIPASFRRVLEAGDPDWTDGLNPQVIIVYGDERRSYLECFTATAIAEVDEKIARMPRASAKRRALQRLYNGQSFPTTVDETGRLVLPAKLRTKIGLDAEAFFIGNGDTFEIWRPDTFDGQVDAVEDDFDPSVDPALYLDGDD